MPTLNWLTREDDIRATSQVPYRLLEEVAEYSSGEAHTGNMLIQGDNLDALKALLPFYAGRVKCIYIDPPYNTHSAFEQYDDDLEHTRWLGMMWPRLELLRELLSEDGSIWVSIRRQRGTLPQGRHGRGVGAEFLCGGHRVAAYAYTREPNGHRERPRQYPGVCKEPCDLA